MGKPKSARSSVGIISTILLVSLLHNSVKAYLVDSIIPKNLYPVDDVTPTDNLAVETASGTVRGAWASQTVRRYLGIPYAKPPVDDLRLRPPVPVSRWSGTRDTTTFGYACIQATPLTYRTVWQEIPIAQDDDCLTLNIWTPTQNPSANLAVMLWIHGGSFRYGTSASPDYDGETLARLGNVVVVTINYRLAVMGFLHVNNSKIYEGNMGLMDQHEALNWTYNNIKKFGGDPSRITLFGESAGSISTGFHLVSPMSRRYIKRAIMQSGSAILAAPPEHISKNERTLAADLPCKKAGAVLTDAEVETCIRKTPSRDLSDAEKDAFPMVIATFSPRHKDNLIPKRPADALAEMANAPTPNTIDLMIGNVKDEGPAFLSMLSPERFSPYRNPHLNRDQAKKFLADALGNVPAERLKKLQDFYYNPIKDDQDFSAILNATFRAVGDLAIACPTRYYADLYSQSAATYYYIMDYETDGQPRNFGPWQGVAHYDEVPLVFGLPDSQHNKFSDRDRRMMWTLIRSWTTFAKTGIPVLPNNKQWPQYSESNPEYIVFDGDVLTTRMDPQGQSCPSVRPILFEPLALPAQ